MPCPHNEISIVQRSQRQSAVAAAAYQSGEKLFCEYDQQVKHLDRHGSPDRWQSNLCSGIEMPVRVPADVPDAP